MMRVYLDNVAASGRVVGDLTPADMEALRRLESAHSVGTIKIVTSRESWREQERTTDPVKRAKLEAARSEVSVVANDHVVQGFFSPLTNRGGSRVTAPIVTDIVDEALFADLKGLGLDDSDAKHLMYAVSNACDRFVTLDRDFLSRRTALEARCPSIRIVRPTELAAELQLDPMR